MKKILKSIFLLLSAGCFAATSWAADSLIARWDNFTGLTSEQTLTPTASATVNGLNGSTWAFNLGGGTVTDGVLATGTTNAPKIDFGGTVNVSRDVKPITVLVAVQLPLTPTADKPFFHIGNGSTGYGLVSMSSNKVAASWGNSAWSSTSKQATIDMSASEGTVYLVYSVANGSMNASVTSVTLDTATYSWQTFGGLTGTGVNATQITFGNFVNATADGLNYNLKSVAVFNGAFAPLADIQSVIRGWEGVVENDVTATLSGNTAWGDATWTPNTPNNLSNVALTVDAASTLTMSGETSILTLTANGSAPLTIDGAKLTANSANINTDVTVNAGAASLGGVTIATDKILTVKDTTTTTSVAGAGVLNLDVGASTTLENYALNTFSGTTKISSGTLKYTNGANRPAGAILVSGENAALQIATNTDILGYSGGLPGITIENDARFEAFQRDTFSRVLTLNNGKLVFNADNQNSGRSIDFYNNSKIVSSGNSTIGGANATNDQESGDLIVASGIIAIRRSNWEIDVTDGTLSVYSCIGTADGNGGSVYKKGAGTLAVYRAATSALPVSVDAGELRLVRKGSLTTGAMTVNADAKLTYVGAKAQANTLTNNGTVAVEGSGSVLDLTGATLAGDGEGSYVAKTGTTLKLTLAQAKTVTLSIEDGATLQVVLSDVEKLVKQDVPGVSKVVFVDANGEPLTEEGEEPGSNNAYVPAIPSCVYTVATDTWSLAPVAGAKVTIDFTGTENQIVDLATLWTVDAFSKLTITGAGTVTANAENTYTGGTEIAEGATVVISNANALGTGPVTGAGKLVCSGVLPPATAALDVADWIGTVTIQNVEGNPNRGATELNLDNYCNNNSTIALNNVTGWVADGTTINNLRLEGEGFTFNNGSTGSYATLTINNLAGDGAFKGSIGQNWKYTVLVKNVANFTGSVNLTHDNASVTRFIVADDATNAEDATIVIAKATTLAEGATWAANGGIKVTDAATIAGTGTIDSALTYASTATSTFGGTLTGGLTVSSGALKLTGILGTVTEGVATYANTISLASGTTLTLGLAQETALNGVISGEGALTINSGKVALNAENTATGKTTVEPGATIAGSGNVGGTLQLDNGSTLDATDGYLNVADAVWLMGKGTNTTITLPASYGVGTPIIACGVEADKVATDLTAKFDGYICEVGENNVIKLALAQVTITLPDAPANTTWWYDGEEVTDGTITFVPGQAGELILKAVDNYFFSDGSTEMEVEINGDSVTKPTVEFMSAQAKIGTTPYETLAAALEAVDAGQTITLLADVMASEIITINKAITLDGNGHTLTSSAGRAINVDCADAVTIKNLTVTTTGERGINVINKACTLTLTAVDVTAYNYTVNVAATVKGVAQITITNSALTGKNVVNVAASDAIITIDGTTLTCVDESDNEYYATLFLNKDAKGATITATDMTFNLSGDSKKAVNQAENGTITIDGLTNDVSIHVAALVRGEYWYGSETVAELNKEAQSGETITLIRDMITAEDVQLNAGVTLDLNGYTSKGTILGTIAVNGGTYVTAQGIAVIGTDAVTYESEDAVFTMDAVAGKISLDSGSITAMNQDEQGNNWTIPGQTLTIKSGVKLTIPAGVTMQVNGSAVIVEDGAVLNIAGAINLYSADATITTSDATMNVTTSVAGCEVAYVDGVYTVVDADPTEGKVAKIGEEYYDTLQAAIDAAEAGATVTVIAGIVTDGPITVTKQVTVDLNGETILATNDKVGDGVFYVKAGGDLTLEGEGTVDAVGANNYNMAIWADGGKVTINGGTYTNAGATSDKANDPHFDLIYVKNGGSATITDGVFICETPRWTLNSHNTLKGTITVMGGTFKNFNPADVDTDDGVTTWCAAGYVAIQDGNTYIVKQSTISGDIIVGDAESGETLTTEAVTVLEQIAADKGVTITTVEAVTGAQAEALNEALQVFEEIVEVEASVATVDWNFGIADITRNGNDLEVTAKVTKGDVDEAAKFADGVSVALVDENDNVLATTDVTANGEATLTISLDKATGKKLSVKASK